MDCDDEFWSQSVLSTNFRLLFIKYACTFDVFNLKKLSSKIWCFTSLTTSMYFSTRRAPCLIRFLRLVWGSRHEKSWEKRSEHFFSRNGFRDAISPNALVQIGFIFSSPSGYLDSLKFLLCLFLLTVKSYVKSKLVRLKEERGIKIVDPINLSPSRSPPTSPIKSSKL